MATIRPFRALRPSPENAAKTAAVPYDVVTTAEARELAAGNALSFLHVSRPEIDLPDGADPYAGVAYQKAAANFESLKRDCPLFVEKDPSIYVYRLRMGDHEQTGIAACCSVDEYDSNVVRKHERTRKDKEDDRTRHILALRAQTGPVFVTYRPRDRINEIVSAFRPHQPIYDFIAMDGVRHTVWRASDEASARLAKEFGSVPLIYIADGHHRAASASRARAQLRSESPDHSGEEEYNFFLAVLFPSDQVQILPYNRVVRDLSSMSPEQFLKALSERFLVSAGPPPQPAKKGEISVYLDGRWYGLKIRADKAAKDDPISALDVSILQNRVLDELLGIKDVRTDKRVDFIGGIKGTSAIERIVDDGRAAVGFSLFPVTVDELMAISDADQTMPPKSTWFEPKLRDGLLTHLV